MADSKVVKARERVANGSRRKRDLELAGGDRGTKASHYGRPAAGREDEVRDVTKRLRSDAIGHDVVYSAAAYLTRLGWELTDEAVLTEARRRAAHVKRCGESAAAAFRSETGEETR